MLPKLPYQSTKRARDTVAFLGLNRTEATQDGELRDAQNISTAEYPTMTTRGARAEVTGYTDPTDLFEWDGHLVVVDGGVLKYDGVSIGEVNPGKKQFAVVNTKLCVFPDKVYIDLTNNSFGHLDAALTTGTTAGSVTITDDSITATVTQMVKQNDTIYRCWYGGGIRNISPGFAVYTYGVDPADVAACWQNGAWDMTSLAALQHYKGFAGSAPADGYLSIGDILIPNCYTSSPSSPTQYLAVCGYYNGGSLPDTTKYNTDGYYMVVTTRAYTDDDSNCYFGASVYRVGTGNVLFSGTFKVGDAVDISGTRFSIADTKHVVITAIDDTQNKLTFASGAISAPYAYYVAAADVPANTVIRLYKSNPSGFNTYFTPAATIQEGRVLWVTADHDYVHVWNLETKHEEALYETAESGTAAYEYAATLYDPIPAEGSPIGITRSVPDLDFVCAKDNRLWGVSNSQENEAYNAETGQVETFTSRVIYASALGDPTNWWVFQGVDTDSYQVAVGSEGDFTAITPLDGVCCWKENRLHKILGSYPSEYYMTEYRIDGVAAGCERSCTVVNETLYYVGRNGVFAYSGGVPVEIGYALGDAPKNAVGGTNGRVWYLCGQRGAAWELLTYDLTHRLWMREDATKAEAFTCIAGEVYMLVGGLGHYDTSTPPVWIADPDKIYKTEQGADTTVAWYAEFVPYYEMGPDSRYASSSLRRKYYLRTLLRLEMPAGSSVTVQVDIDDRGWQTLLNADTDRDMVKSIEIPPRRCDKLVLRISGTGAVKLRHMAREFIVGGTRP